MSSMDLDLDLMGCMYDNYGYGLGIYIYIYDRCQYIFWCFICTLILSFVIYIYGIVELHSNFYIINLVIL